MAGDCRLGGGLAPARLTIGPTAKRLDELAPIADWEVGAAGDTELAVARRRAPDHEGSEQVIPYHREETEVDVTLGFGRDVMVPMTRRHGPEIGKGPYPHIDVRVL